MSHGDHIQPARQKAAEQPSSGGLRTDLPLPRGFHQWGLLLHQHVRLLDSRCSCHYWPVIQTKHTSLAVNANKVMVVHHKYVSLTVTRNFRGKLIRKSPPTRKKLKLQNESSYGFLFMCFKSLILGPFGDIASQTCSQALESMTCRLRQVFPSVSGSW